MKNKKTDFATATPTVALVIIGAILGISLGIWLASDFNQIGFDILSLDTIIYILLWCVLATFMHELGHLLFGYLTGYKFVYFKMLGVMFYKSNGKWQTARERGNGALGQCLMAPDFEYKQKMPYVLYNLGGVLINLLLTALCVVLIVVYGQQSFTLAGIIVNGIFTIINFLPIRSLKNDGYNVFMLARSESCKKAYYSELKITAETLAGKTFSQMPETIFNCGIDDLKYPSVCTSLYVQYCYFIATNQTEKATETITMLYNRRSEMPLPNANTVSVEYFNCLMLFHDDRVNAAKTYNAFDQSIRNAIQVSPTSFVVVARILVNALSNHDDRQFASDCVVAEKLLNLLRTPAEAEYSRIIFEKAKERYREATPDPFESF